MKSFYLIAAVLGAVLPWLMFLQFIGNNGVALGGFVQALFANGAAAGFTLDLLVSSAVFWAWMAARRHQGHPAPWLFIALNLGIGLSCALPLYLYLDQRQTPTAPD